MHSHTILCAPLDGEISMVWIHLCFRIATKLLLVELIVNIQTTISLKTQLPLSPSAEIFDILFWSRLICSVAFSSYYTELCSIQCAKFCHSARATIEFTSSRANFIAWASYNISTDQSSVEAFAQSMATKKSYGCWCCNDSVWSI